MNLIRNQGFEMGDMSFWEFITGGSVAVSDVASYKGDYSLRMFSAMVDNVEIRTKDYMEVAYNQVYHIGLWANPSNSSGIIVRVEEYDAELNLLTARYIENKTIDPGWSQQQFTYTPGREVTYIRVKIVFVPGDVDEYVYLDNVNLELVEINKLSRDYIELANIVSQTASGETSGDKKDIIGFRDYLADLRVTSLTGAAPTLDVDIMEGSEAGGNVLIASFTQAVGSTTERIALPKCDGRQVYLIYTLPAGMTDCDFRCGLIGRR